MKIFIMGKYQHARHAAMEAGLQPHQWVLLDNPHKLMGCEGPHVVYLETAREVLTGERLHDMMDILYSRSAIMWTELDLINRKVPR